MLIEKQPAEIEAEEYVVEQDLLLGHLASYQRNVQIVGPVYATDENLHELGLPLNFRDWAKAHGFTNQSYSPTDWKRLLVRWCVSRFLAAFATDRDMGDKYYDDMLLMGCTVSVAEEVSRHYSGIKAGASYYGHDPPYVHAVAALHRKLGVLVENIENSSSVAT